MLGLPRHLIFMNVLVVFTESADSVFKLLCQSLVCLLACVIWQSQSYVLKFRPKVMSTSDVHQWCPKVLFKRDDSVYVLEYPFVVCLLLKTAVDLRLLVQEHIGNINQRVMCHVSHVTCHINFFLFLFGQSGEAYHWRVCYQRAYPV